MNQPHPNAPRDLEIRLTLRAPAGVPPDDVASVAQARQWLEEKMRAWSGRA